MSLILSDRQYPMLREFIDRGRNFIMPIEEAQVFNQITFRSMLVRQYVRYKPAWNDGVGSHRGGFVVTTAGRDAFQLFHQSERILRAHPELPLTAYFDPAAYGLDLPGARKSPRSEPKLRAVSKSA